VQRQRVSDPAQNDTAVPSSHLVEVTCSSSLLARRSPSNIQ
jgi:hypothetical protein